jgi:hypothetical protein
MRELHLENVRRIPAVSRLIKEIDDFCADNMVIGFHYTRAFADDILSQGLRVRTGEEIRAEFLSRFRHLFTAVEIEALELSWAQYFGANMKEVRDSRIWFNFTTCALGNGGAELLRKNYGGEQVYFCIDELRGIGDKIATIGQPLIVKCQLMPKHVHTYLEDPWGSIVTSAYHSMVNPDAHQTDQDGWQSVPVPPERIELI